VKVGSENREVNVGIEWQSEDHHEDEEPIICVVPDDDNELFVIDLFE
jgi:hypothetical protein